nr:TolC family protein [Bacteroidota bacterium]
MKKYIILIITVLICSYGSRAQTLEEYFKIAAQNNPGLQAKYISFEAALQKVPQVSTLPDPNFSFGYFISPVETRVGPQKAKFSLTQMFPWFGTLKVQGDAAALMAEAKYQAFVDARNALYYQVAAAYYPLYELKKWKQIEQENIEILQVYKTIATKNFENGKEAMVDVLRVDILLKDAVTNLIILNKKEKPLLAAFNTRLNRDLNQAVQVQDSLSAAMLAKNFRRDSLLSNNPVLKELDLKVKANEAAARAATKQGLPKLGIGLDYVIVGERNDVAVADNGKDVLMPMVSVSIPIFRGKYKAAVKEAGLMQQSYSLQKVDYANKLVSNYESVWFDTEQQNQLINLYNEQISETKQALNLLFSAYGNSGKDFEEVLRMQQQLLKYQKMKASALSQYHVALAKLNYLTSYDYLIN